MAAEKAALILNSTNLGASIIIWADTANSSTQARDATIFTEQRVLDRVWITEPATSNHIKSELRKVSSEALEQEDSLRTSVGASSTGDGKVSASQIQSGIGIHGCRTA